MDLPLQAPVVAVDHVLKHYLSRLTLCHTRRTLQPKQRIDEGLRCHGAFATSDMRHDRAHSKKTTGHRNAVLTSLGVTGNYRIGHRNSFLSANGIGLHQARRGRSPQ